MRGETELPNNIYRIMSQRHKNESDIELLVANVLYVTGWNFQRWK